MVRPGLRADDFMTSAMLLQVTEIHEKRLNRYTGGQKRDKQKANNI